MVETLRDRINHIVEAIAPTVFAKKNADSSVSAAEAEESWQLLVDAATRNDAAFFQQIVEEDQSQLADLVKDRDSCPMSILMLAAFSGQTDVVRMLLEAGADPHFKSERFWIKFDALSLAAAQQHHDIIQLLISAGADPNALLPIARPLTEAVQKGHLETARLLISLGSDPHARGLSSDNTLLIEASSKGHANLVRLLLAASVDIHIANNLNETALDVACAKGRVEIVGLLVNVGSNVNCTGRLHPPLIGAAESPARLRFLEQQMGLDEGETLKNIDDRATHVVQILLGAGANPNIKSGHGSTALLTAASQGLTEMVRLLLAANADANLANSRAKTSNTPLIAAIEHGHADVVQLLLAAEADPTAPNRSGIAPIDLASRKGLSQIVQILQNQGAIANPQTVGITELMGAVRCGDRTTVQQAIAAGVDLDRDDRDFPSGGLTALMYAAKAGSLDLVDDLIAAGADVNRHDARQLPWHKTALMYAVEQNHLAVVRRLLEGGADPNASDRLSKPGRTALMYAAIEDNVDIVRVLLEAGAIATTKDRKGNTALHHAYSNRTIVDLLLTAGADPYDRGEDDSPIALAALMKHGGIVQRMLAVEPLSRQNADNAMVEALDSVVGNNDVASIQALIDHGVDINQCSQDGDIPLVTVSNLGRLETVQFLVSAGANLSLMDSEGNDSLSIAIRHGHLEVAHWLLEVGAILPETVDASCLLMDACQQGTEAVQMALDLGVDVNTCDEDNDTALGVAVRLRKPEVVQRLIDAGIDLEKYGADALEEATEYGFREIIDILKKAGA